jgi:hypothetical protein
MCVDYTDLNKHCPEDDFGLPHIDQVVNSMAGCVLLCFLDCYSGYHQIKLKEEDQIKTAFITPFGTYAYKTMSFGLKNAGDSCSSSAKAVFFRFNLEAMCHRIKNVNFLLKFKGYSHVQVSYKLTSCHEHNCRCDDDRVFPNRLDPLDRIQSNLFNGLT